MSRQLGLAPGFRLAEAVFIGLGSNLGDSAAILRRALERLRPFSRSGPPGTATFLVSSLWQTSPVDCPAGSPPFVNAVAGFWPQPDETPESLLARLQSLEQEFGRQPKKTLNEPRPLDLDLLVFGAETRADPSLIVPHPRAHLRRFVLQPLSEIAPDLRLPGQTRNVAQLLAALQTPETLRCLGPLP